LPASPGPAATLLQRAASELDGAPLRAELRRALAAAGDFEALSDAWVREVEEARYEGDAEAEEVALRALSNERRRAEDPEGRALVQDELAELLGRDSTRAGEAASAFAEAGGLWESERSLPQAFEAYRRSLALSENSQVRDRAIAICRSLGQPAELARLIEGGVATMPEAERAKGWIELADLYGGPLDAAAKAEPALWHAHQLAPDLEGLEERLRSLLAREGRRVELGAFLLASAERAEQLDRQIDAARLFAAAAEELLAIGDGDGAATAMASSARHQPSPERLLRAADLRFEAGDLAAAGELYGHLLEQAPVGAPQRVLERRADALRVKGEAEPLARFLERAAEAGPAPATWYAEAAEAWERVESGATGEDAELAMRARHRCERRAFEADPADPRLFAAVIGSVAAADPDEWARLLRLRAGAIPAEAPSLQRTLGEVFWTARRMGEAAAAYDAALAADPSDTLALVGRAEVAFATREPLESLAEQLRDALRSAPSLRPDHSEAAFRMGALLEQEGGFALASEFLEQAIELAPGSQHTAEALQLLDAAATALGDREKQIDVRLRRWSSVKPEGRLEVLHSLLEVLDDHHPAAASALREAFAIEPTAAVAERLATALELAGDWAGLAGHLEGLASTGGEAIEDAGASLRPAAGQAGSLPGLLPEDQTRRHGWALAAADVYAGRLADAETAERLRGLAVELGAGSPPLLRKTLKACKGGSPELHDRALAALVACAPEPEAAELRLRRARLADASFGALRGRRAWEEVLEGGAAAVGREEALERRLDFENEDGRPQEALRTVLQLAEFAEGPLAKGSRLQQAAKLAEDGLGDSDGAIELLKRAAEEAGDARAYTLLAEACDRAGRTADAAAAMTIEVSRREPGERRRERQRKLGLMLARDLNRPTEALEHLKAAWEGSGADPQLLEELAFCAGKLGDAELELSALEALPADAPGSAVRARRKAALLEGLGRPAEATDAWRRAFLLEAADGPTFDSLVRQLESRKGWDELVDVLLRRVEALLPLGEDSRDVRAELLSRRASLLAGELGDLESAEAGYREALEVLPGHRASLAALAAICQARGATAEAAELLEAELRGEGAALFRATLGLRLGRLRQELGDAAAAEKALREALDDARKADGKALIGEIQGALGASLLLLDRPEEALLCAKAALATALPAELTRLRSLCAEASARLGFAEQAGEHWRVVLELQPGDTAALAGLEALARTQGPAQLAKVLRERAEVDADPMHRARTLLEAAELYFLELDDAVSGEELLREAVEGAPDEPEPFARLRKVLESQSRHEELAEALRLRARHTTSEEIRAESLRDQGEILRTRLRDPRRAAEAYTRSLELRPADAVAAEGLAESLLSLGQGDRASEYYRRALAGGSHLGEFFLHYRLGEIAQRAGRAEQALESYQASIAANPSFLPARESAAQVADALGRVDVAVAVLRGVLSVLDPDEFGDQVAGVLLRIGELEKRSLHFEAAIEAFERSAELGPKDPRPLQDLAVLYQHRARWLDAVRVLLKIADLLEGAPSAVALVEAAVLCLDKLADMAKAADLLERAVAIEPPDERALQRLAEISAALGRHDRLVDIADRVGALVPSGWPSWLDELWVPLALAYELAGRVEDAHQAIVRARRAAPTAEILLERQRALAEKAGRVEEQLELEEQIIELVAPDHHLEAATRLRALSRRAFELHEDPDRAERLLERAEELAPARSEDRRLLADLRRRNPESASRAASGYLELVREKWPPPPDLLRALGATAAAIGESDLARSALGLAGAMAGEPPPLPPSKRVLPEDVWRALPLPADSPIGTLLLELAPFLEPLFPPDLRRFGLAPADRLGPGRAPQVQRWVDEARSSLRVRTVQVFLVPGLDGVTLENSQPHALIVGGGPLATLGPGPMQFLIAQRLALIELGFTLPVKFSPRDFGTLAMLLACFLADPEIAPQGEAARLEPFLAALAESCPASLRQRHAATGQRLAQGVAQFDARRCLAEAMLRAAKIALWSTGDLPGALGALGFIDASESARGLAPWETPLGQALARWAFSAEYLSLRAEQGNS
jgi:tetratricopeptide (TPR) repeat protein